MSVQRPRGLLAEKTPVCLELGKCILMTCSSSNEYHHLFARLPDAKAQSLFVSFLLAIHSNTPPQASRSSVACSILNKISARRSSQSLALFPMGLIGVLSIVVLGLIAQVLGGNTLNLWHDDRKCQQANIVQSFKSKYCEDCGDRQGKQVIVWECKTCFQFDPHPISTVACTSETENGCFRSKGHTRLTALRNRLQKVYDPNQYHDSGSNSGSTT
ncbi:hypothetical protein KEM48_006711 [Puccinia striiformis f. sp. tritici PST-130]|nr:hypothetical protein KEM48_006711 [Puccinia striiformis f. sp. tritici PST-130]